MCRAGRQTPLSLTRVTHTVTVTVLVETLNRAHSLNRSDLYLCNCSPVRMKLWICYI